MVEGSSGNIDFDSAMYNRVRSLPLGTRLAIILASGIIAGLISYSLDLLQKKIYLEKLKRESNLLKSECQEIIQKTRNSKFSWGFEKYLSDKKINLIESNLEEVQELIGFVEKVLKVFFGAVNLADSMLAENIRLNDTIGQLKELPKLFEEFNEALSSEDEIEEIKRIKNVDGTARFFYKKEFKINKICSEIDSVFTSWERCYERMSSNIGTIPPFLQEIGDGKFKQEITQIFKKPPCFSEIMHQINDVINKIETSYENFEICEYPSKEFRNLEKLLNDLAKFKLVRSAEILEESEKK